MASRGQDTSISDRAVALVICEVAEQQMRMSACTCETCPTRIGAVWGRPLDPLIDASAE